MAINQVEIDYFNLFQAGLGLILFRQVRGTQKGLFLRLVGGLRFVANYPLFSNK
jgi:hypothetical protein